MKMLRLAPVVLSAVALPLAWGVYAPIPEQEQGKAFVVTLRAGLSHDSNIFGAATGAIDSAVYSFAPSLKFNSSVTDQTFVSASYRLTLDNFEDRPGDKTLDSHNLDLRLAHAFSQTANIDLSNAYTVAKNPESLLAGVPLNTDQSYKRNQFDGRLTGNLTERTSLTGKARFTNYDYDDATLGASIDRNENLIGLAATHTLLPELKLNAEVRRQEVDYRTGGATKDKESNFLIGGFDYNMARKFTASGRLGYEWRQRSGAPDEDAPYVELSGKYDYAERSYLTGGFVHTLEEASDVARFTDTRVNRFFVNVQHSLSPLFVLSGSLTYEPSTLQGRGLQADIDERTTRFGLGLTYLPNRQWSISGTFDSDRVNSDLASREMSRRRYGVNAAFSF